MFKLSVKVFLGLVFGLSLIVSCSVVNQSSDLNQQGGVKLGVSYPAWAVGVAYSLGQDVTYNGENYQCITAHTSESCWTPNITPALWKDLGPASGSSAPASSAASSSKPASSSSSSKPSSVPASSSKPASSSSSKPIQPVGNWPSKYFAPFIDCGAWPTFNVTNAYQAAGTKYYNLGFVTAYGTTAEWFGAYPMSANFFADSISYLRSLGGDVIVSFGGQAGTELAYNITDIPTPVAQYQSVISQYSLTRIDFDIEGFFAADTESVDRRNQAIAVLEANNPKLTVQYTLPVFPSGLPAEELYILQSAVKYGARIDLVNVMAMDYGDAEAPNPSGQMGAYAVDAGNNTYSQCVSLGMNNTTVGVTPMIGVNDQADEDFTTSDAATLLSWGQSKNYAQMIAMWSANRDQSMFSWAYSKIFVKQ